MPLGSVSQDLVSNLIVRLGKYNGGMLCARERSAKAPYPHHCLDQPISKLQFSSSCGRGPLTGRCYLIFYHMNVASACIKHGAWTGESLEDSVSQLQSICAQEIWCPCSHACLWSARARLFGRNSLVSSRLFVGMMTVLETTLWRTTSIDWHHRKMESYGAVVIMHLFTRLNVRLIDLCTDCLCGSVELCALVSLLALRAVLLESGRVAVIHVSF